MNRGEVYTAATGSGFGGKPRPVLVIQADLYNRAPNIVVALIESATGEARRVRPRVTPDGDNGLYVVSDVAVDLLVTVPRRKVGKAIGRLDAEDMRRVDRALATFLGLAG